MKVQLSRGAVLATTLIPPAWYPARISRVTNHEAEDKSLYDRIFVVVADGEFRDKELNVMSSEKFTSAEILSLYEAALGVKITRDKVIYPDGKEVPIDEFSVDHDDLIDKMVMVKTVRGEYNKKPQDNIEAFRPFKAKTA